MKIKWYAKIHIDMRERERERSWKIHIYACMLYFIYVCNMYVFVYVGRESET